MLSLFIFKEHIYLWWRFPHILPIVSNIYPELFINCCQTLKTFGLTTSWTWFFPLFLSLWMEKQMITNLWEALKGLYDRRSLWGERRDCRVEKQKWFLVKWLCTEVIPSCDNSVQACKKRGLAACHITGLVTGKEWWFLKTGLWVYSASSKRCQEISLPIKHPGPLKGQANLHIHLQVKGIVKRFPLHSI